MVATDKDTISLKASDGVFNTSGRYEVDRTQCLVPHYGLVKCNHCLSRADSKVSCVPWPGPVRVASVLVSPSGCVLDDQGNTLPSSNASRSHRILSTSTP